MIISTAKARSAVFWKQREITWQGFCDRCALSNWIVGSETHDEYMKMTKTQQGNLKDVGGFVGGALREGRRKGGYCTERGLITLDMDNAKDGTTEAWEAAIDALGFTYLIYSTRRHDPAHPRLRAIFPTDRPMRPEEYQPAARAIANIIDSTMQVFDPTTFEPERLMFWPSASCDSVKELHQRNTENLSVGDLLADFYADWTDAATWPKCPGEDAVLRTAMHQQDPTGKGGTIGAFCQIYDIPAAMERFLPGVYIPAGHDRYTYAFGTTVGGAVMYDGGKFLYSHHATDPCSSRLVNAFDMVRLHKFGEKDNDPDVQPGTPVGKLPSYTAMCYLARSDPQVAQLEEQERAAHAVDSMPMLSEAAAEDAQEDTESVPETPDKADKVNPEATIPDENWRSTLDRDGKGHLRASVQNMCTIIEHNEQLRGRIWQDQFAHRLMCRGPFPWPGRRCERGWNDTDDAGMRWFLDNVYGIGGKDKVFDAVNIVAEAHATDPVKDYLSGLTWDKEPRLDTLFIDYLGAKDCPYARAITRKAFVAAAARAFQPGYKYDQVVILTGPQGIGKSTILRKMGRKWFSDSVSSFLGKDAREAIQGVWIVELGELTALDKAETEASKQFISQTEDWFRPAYGRRADQYPRRCVFFGTSNKDEFLRDTTGNRRFWPLQVGVTPPIMDVFDDLTSDIIDQLWAEAVVRCREHEATFLPPELEPVAIEEQEKHREEDPWFGEIGEFVDKEVPKGWTDWDMERRLAWWDGNLVDAKDVQTTQRDKICVAEVWCELFRKDKVFLDTRDQRRIGAVLSALPGWERAQASRRFGPHGKQKCWVRDEVFCG